MALFLLTARWNLAAPLVWTPARAISVLVSTLLGFLVVPALVFGAMSFRPSRTLTRPVVFSALGTALVLGMLSVGISFQSPDLLTRFALRHAPRTFALAGALFFCAGVFYQRMRVSRSSAALLTCISCLAYGLHQCLYTAAQVLQIFSSDIGAPEGSGLWAMDLGARLVYFDVLLLCGICLGTVLLLLEEYQRSERALLDSVNREREVEDENMALQIEIHARQQIESVVWSGDDPYQQMVERSEDLCCTHDFEGRMFTCNAAAARTLGYNVQEMLASRISDHIAPEFRREFDEYIARIRRDGVATGLLRVVTRAGELRFWAYRNTLHTGGVDAPIVRGTARDVTERLLAERALRFSEEKFGAAFRSSPCAMTITSLANGRFIDVNESFERQMGFAKAEVIGRTSADLGLWIEQADYTATYNDITAHGELPEREVQLRTKSGRPMTAVLSAATITVSGERCVLSVGVDVTERRETEARHRAILKALPDWVFLTSTEGVFLELHARDQRHLLMSPNEFLGRHVADVLPLDLATRLQNCFREAARSDTPATLDYSLGSGGEERFYEVRSVAAERNHVLSLVRDVTDQRRAEASARELQAELAHAGRVLALGTLTGSLAHEINQPLAAITTNAHVALGLLARTASVNDDIRDALRDIESDSQRIDAVVRRLRLLMRKGRHERDLVDVNLIVKDVLALVHANLVQRRVTIGTGLGPDLPAVRADRIQLQQVVLNLLMNAAEAVSVLENADDRHVQVTTGVRSGDVIVSISDRGVGVSDADFDRMFDPFYTTKRDGMGLGLSICRTIIDAHAGQIAAVRNPDRGLTCWFSLSATPVSNLVGAPGDAGPPVQEGATA